jgi:hypothetical protein
MKKVGFCILLVFIVGAAFSQSKEDNIRLLLKVTGADKLALEKKLDNLRDTIRPRLQELYPKVPSRAWQMLRNKIDKEGFIKRTVTVYSNHYSDNEILELIEFYKTPLGQRVVEEEDAINQELSSAWQEWGASIANEIMQELRDMGYSS